MTRNRRASSSAAEAPSGAGPAPLNALDARTAVPALYRAHLDYVWHSLRRLGVPDRDIPDLAHDVFLAVARVLPGYDPQRPIRPWLFGICFRVASDQLRLHRSTREILGEEVDAFDIGPSPEQALLDGEARLLVQDGLMALALPLRAVLIMHDLGEHTAPEIAQALEIPLKTVYSRLRIARLRFMATASRLAVQRGLR